MILGAAATIFAVSACDAWLCWLNSWGAAVLNEDYLAPTTTPMTLEDRPVFVDVSVDGEYVAACSWGDGTDPTANGAEQRSDLPDPNERGYLSLFPADSDDPGDVQKMVVGTRPYGVLWVTSTRLLVCNEGLAGTGGTVPLQLVQLTRATLDPTDPNYNVLSLGDPNDVTIIGDGYIYGPSVAAPLVAGSTTLYVTSRFMDRLYEVSVAGQDPSWSQLLPPSTDEVSPLDEPRGVAVSPDGVNVWICNYGSGADNRTALALVHELIAFKLNVLRGVTAPDQETFNQAADAADQWIVNNRDPDEVLPVRWPEPDQGPDGQAVAEAEDLTTTLRTFNVRSACPDPNDASCPMSAAQWAATPVDDWPNNPDPNLLRGMILGDPNSGEDPNDLTDVYAYTAVDPNLMTVSEILSRDVEAGGEVTVYNLATEDIIARIPVPPRPRSIRFLPDNSAAVVTCSGHDGLTGHAVVISASTMTPTAQREMPFVPAQVRIHALGVRAFISPWTGSQMAVINVAGLCADSVANPGDTTFYTVLGRPVGIETTVDTDLLWSANFTRSQAVGLDIFEGAIRIDAP